MTGCEALLANRPNPSDEEEASEVVEEALSSAICLFCSSILFPFNFKPVQDSA